MSAEQRRAEIEAGLHAVHNRIEQACADAGRSPEEVTLIVVTKTFPATDVAILTELGVQHLGESRTEDAAPKVDQVRELVGEQAASALVWHQVGQVQTKKSGAVARWADVVHSLDQAKLVGALDRAAGSAGRRRTALIQVSLDGDPHRGGALIEQVPDLAEAVAAAEHLDLGGVMAVAPLGRDPTPALQTLVAVARTVRERHPQATIISAGMSGDLEQAIAQGATHLRVGTAVLGSRPIRQ